MTQLELEVMRHLEGLSGDDELRAVNDLVKFIEGSISTAKDDLLSLICRHLKHNRAQEFEADKLWEDKELLLGNKVMFK